MEVNYFTILYWFCQLWIIVILNFLHDNSNIHILSYVVLMLVLSLKSMIFLTFWHAHFSNKKWCVENIISGKKDLRYKGLVWGFILLWLGVWDISDCKFRFLLSSVQLLRLFAIHGLQHARLPCPSPTPTAYSNSCPSSQWSHPNILSSVIPFSCHLQ